MVLWYKKNTNVDGMWLEENRPKLWYLYNTIDKDFQIQYSNILLGQLIEIAAYHQIYVDIRDSSVAGEKTVWIYRNIHHINNIVNINKKDLFKELFRMLYRIICEKNNQ